MSYPVQRGVVTNWEDLEALLRHTYDNELRVAPEDHAVMLTESAQNPKAHRERLTQIMFETFNVPGMLLGCQPVLSLYGCGHITGVVVESGDGVTCTLPVFDGYCIPQVSQMGAVAGRDLTDYMARLLSARGVGLSGHALLSVARGVKEQYCSVAVDYDTAMMPCSLGASAGSPTTFQLPDGSTLALGTESTWVPEAMFQPGLLGLVGPSLHRLVHDTVMGCDIDVRKALMRSVHLSGGNTLFSGMQSRLSKELTDMVHDRAGMEVKVFADRDRLHAAWVGASIVASLDSFGSWQSGVVSLDEYNEVGPSIAGTKWPQALAGGWGTGGLLVRSVDGDAMATDREPLPHAEVCSSVCCCCVWMLCATAVVAAVAAVAAAAAAVAVAVAVASHPSIHPSIHLIHASHHTCP
jgi:hypothetical protein